MGKTSTVLAAYRILKSQGLIKGGMLVVSPLRPAYSTWPNEVDKWDNFEEITYAVVHGPKWRNQLALDVDIHITTPEMLEKIFAVPPKWDILCIDESTKFKDTQTKRFKNLKPALASFPRRWILSGTLSPNGLQDLFGQIYILDLGRALGRYVTHYRNEYFHTLPYNPYNYLPNPGAFEKITARVDPLVMRLRAVDHLDMAELRTIDVKVDLPKEVEKTYKEIQDDFFTQLADREVIAANAAVAGGKLRQICSGALYTDSEGAWNLLHDEKLNALRELIESLCGESALVMYEFNHERQRLQKAFGSHRPFLGGGTSASQANVFIQEFNEGTHQLLFCHPASMAHGLNLQDRCHHIIWLTLTWNLEHYQQSIARIWRQGQKHPVVLNHRIIVRNTIEERVASTLEQKDASQEALFQALRYNIPSK